MTTRTLTQRELNRALLARHMLITRERMTAHAAIEKLAGMQAQIPRAPYVGLWTRLEGFRRDELAELILNRQVVKGALMRGTLHFFTADDYVRHRATLQPGLSRFAEAIVKTRDVTLDLESLVGKARAYIGEQPRSFAEISTMLTELHPAEDVGGMRHHVRMTLPLLQVPVADKMWSYPGSPRFTLAESWIGREIDTHGDLPDLVRRYLGAFGPASIVDMQTWSGMTGLKSTFEAMRGELVTYRDERKRELFDVPGAPVPDGDTPVPARFIPELDNLLIAHEDRRRVIADEYQKRVMKVNAQGSITVLVDGFVRGVAMVSKAKSAAELAIEPYEPIAKPDRAALVEEGEKLIRFVEPDAKSYAVRFIDDV